MAIRHHPPRSIILVIVTVVAALHAQATQGPADPPQRPDSPPEVTSDPSPERCRFDLQDGTRILGTVARDHVTLRTTYGSLEIPLSDVYEIRCAEQVDPGFEQRVRQLVRQLGDSSFAIREEAQEALARIGVRAARLLEPAAAETGDLEVQARVEELLADMMLGEGVLDEQEPPLTEDEVVTSKFTARGTLEVEAFDLATPYGPLRIERHQVRKIFLRAPPRSTLLFTVSGAHAVNREFLRTGLELQPGDHLRIEASGTIHVRNYGRRFSPEGDPSYGTYSSNIPIGALIARLGEKGEPFFLGSSYDKQILREGTLYLAVAFDDGGQPDRATGEWKVRATVLRGMRDED